MNIRYVYGVFAIDKLSNSPLVEEDRNLQIHTIQSAVHISGSTRCITAMVLEQSVPVTVNLQPF